MKLTIQGKEVEIIEKPLTISVDGETVYPALERTKTYKSPGYTGTNYKEAEGKDFEILNALGLTTKSIVMVSNRILHLNNSWHNIAEEFDQIKRQSLKFLNQDITDDIWAVLVSLVELPVLGQVFAALGLNKNHHLVILGFARAEKDLYSDIIDRGLERGQVTFGVLSSDVDQRVFEKAFTKAKVGLDMSERDADGVAVAMKAPDPIKALSALGLQEELLAYTKFDKELWPALKSTLPIKKMAQDVTERMAKATLDKGSEKFALNWCLMRLQYHMYKIPVVSHRLGRPPTKSKNT